MDDQDNLARLRDEENRDELAIRRAERRMAAEEREMEREMDDLEAAEGHAEQEIEKEWRREHWGHEPERRPAWRDDGE